MTKACFIMGDQLSLSLDSLQAIDKDCDLVFMCEVRAEATHIKHHKKKLVLIFSAMRHFAAELETLGYKVIYSKLDDPKNSGSFQTELTRFTEQYNIQQIIATKPSEYRVFEQLKTSKLPIVFTEDNRFLSSLEDFKSWASPRKQLRMEYFYRNMRKRYQVLMDGEQPVLGQWNFDQDNRQKLSTNQVIPAPYLVEPDQITESVIALVSQEFSEHFGDLLPFNFAVTRTQAQAVLHDFIEHRLSNFGTYQDAMLENEPWLFHSHISFYLNIGLLLPLECIQAAERAYNQGKVAINSAEGFIRQILGWREYVRGIYWLKMPAYKQENFLNADQDLPDFYWTGNTNMNCLKQAILETKTNAYAHHIQRLMVLGNFALIYGVKPSEINEWFWIVYADAFEWVELPNVSGMVLFADGGYLASKPYAAGGSYINKMSNYCQNCQFKVKEKVGPSACPFNYLYWDFLARNRAQLGSNQRLRMIYSTYDRMTEVQKSAINDSARKFYEKS